MKQFGARYLKIMGHDTLVGRSCSKAFSEFEELFKYCDMTVKSQNSVTNWIRPLLGNSTVNTTPRQSINMQQ
jgi:hypothetical protein